MLAAIMDLFESSRYEYRTMPGLFTGLNTVVALFTIVALAVSSYGIYMYSWIPSRIRKALMRQDFFVLPYRPIAGDLPQLKQMEAQAQQRGIASPSQQHLLVPHILPFYDMLLSQHPGSRVVYWWGNVPEAVLNKVDDARRLFSSGDGNRMHKPTSFTKAFHMLWGRGLMLANGKEWHLQRNFLRPAFFAEKLKGLVADMVTSSVEMIEKWKLCFDEGNLDKEVEIDIVDDLKNVAADILTRTMFGSSYLKGKSVFERQEVLFEMTTKLRIRIATIPFYEYLPTDLNRKIWALNKRNNKELGEILEERKRSRAAAAAGAGAGGGGGSAGGTDLLGLMLDAVEEEGKELNVTMQQVIDHCKTFFFAGHETSAILLQWTMVLLSLHQDWQQRAREEVWDVCGKHGEPQADHLNKLRVLGMILNESLRLYPPVPVYGRRKLSNQVQIDDETVLPSGTGVVVPCLYIHRDKEVWGKDADEFRPDRFAKGVAQVGNNAFMPFGLGPRTCIGQQYAVMEAKTILVVILQNFEFRLSPKYRHAPVADVTMRPKYGVPLLLKSLSEK